MNFALFAVVLLLYNDVRRVLISWARLASNGIGTFRFQISIVRSGQPDTSAPTEQRGATRLSFLHDRSGCYSATRKP